MIASSLPLFGFDLFAFSSRPRVQQEVVLPSEKRAGVDFDEARGEERSPDNRHPESFYWGIHLPS